MKKQDCKIFIVICLAIIFETSIYFLVKFSPFNVTLLESSIDNTIPLISQFIYFYILWYILIFIIPFLFYKKNKDTFYKYLTSLILTIIFCGIIYFLFPSTVSRPMIENSNFSTILTNIIYKIDNPPLNCFPSGHCILCFYFIFGLSEIKNIKPIYKVGLFISFVSIILSTIFVKQHVIYDVIGAIIISVSIWGIVNKTKIYNKLKQRID